MTMKEKGLTKFGKGQENGIRILSTHLYWRGFAGPAAKFIKC